ncbi:MAG: hypothetical protein GPJ54_18575 [Candidatus Heimdallarchaeota archaeon]|nr:hypothetical protein [Candidatus Heimdallarchaeota archaeon]
MKVWHLIVIMLILSNFTIHSSGQNEVEIIIKEKPQNITGTRLELNQSITWVVYSETETFYTVNRENIQDLTGRFTLQHSVNVTLERMTIGLHNYTLHLFNWNFSISDSVQISVLPSQIHLDEAVIQSEILYLPKTIIIVVIILIIILGIFLLVTKKDSI